jgi:hypothetical protein
MKRRGHSDWILDISVESFGLEIRLMIYSWRDFASGLPRGR